MTYRHITAKNYMTNDIKFSHIVAALITSWECWPLHACYEWGWLKSQICLLWPKHILVHFWNQVLREMKGTCKSDHRNRKIGLSEVVNICEVVNISRQDIIGLHLAAWFLW